MKLKQRYRFITAHKAKELESRKEKALFYIWNSILLLLSSAGVTALSLTLAIGNCDPMVFVGYFTHPLIFILNWIPVLVLQMFLLFILNRQWAAFLISSALIAGVSIGNFYKTKLRFEPFVFSDIDSIGAALGVAEKYSLQLNSRIVLLLLAVAAGTVFLLFLARGRASGKIRLGGLLLLALSIWPLWRFVYSNGDIYNNKTKNSEYVIAVWKQQEYISKGFMYPFIYSITDYKSKAPTAYDEQKAKELISAYRDEELADGEKVNIFVLQIESFCDLREYGLENVDNGAYEFFDELKNNSVSGHLIPNVMGGGTIDTEQSVLTGSYGHIENKKDSPSHVRYFNSQGYFTTGSHPNRCDYYNRVNANKYLGFQEYLFKENHYQELGVTDWNCDETLIPEAFRLFTEKIAEGEKVFSFNVSLQNHSPYDSQNFNYEKKYWDAGSSSNTTDNMINNYICAAVETQQLLREELKRIDTLDEPVICVFYGDHKPYFGNEVYTEAGIIFEHSNAQGQIDYYSTPYYIWANQAAKELTGNSFVGEGPMISPGYLMNTVFSQLGWRGSAYMQFIGDIMDEMPVVSTNDIYVEDGQPVLELSQQAREKLQAYEFVQYYLNENYKNS